MKACKPHACSKRAESRARTENKWIRIPCLCYGDETQKLWKPLLTQFSP
ncbi:hypothetical protein COPCOM_01651 [Coprococcus comes ATCC 27758]|uniref:Uncharacterized protein n=1 Tax=Coprococcus comes ATCC 27758 TaxID=470146 RepID=C0B927_9FIRM|nr:hypothetical protein COPCOM_01651 [Coprococcus comes ATCC 27758]